MLVNTYQVKFCNCYPSYKYKLEVIIQQTMLRDSQISNYINLIKRLHKQKKNNQFLQQRPSFRTKVMEKTLSLFPSGQIIKEKPKKQISLSFKSATSQHKRPIKANVSDVSLDYQNKNEKKHTFYGQYCSDIQKKFQFRQSMQLTSNLKKKPVFVSKLIREQRKNTLIQAIANNSKSKHRKTIEESQTHHFPKQKVKKKPFFNNSISLSEAQVKKMQMYKTRIRTQSHGITKLKKMFKKIQKIQTQTVKEKETSIMRNDGKIQGWQDHNQSQFLDFFN